MHLELPADARVHIPIAPMGSLPPSEGTSVPSALPAPPPRRRLLKGTALLLLVGGAYCLRGHSARQSGAMQARAQSSGTPLAADDRAPRTPPDVPPAFARQLQQPPAVTPPPGAAPSAPAAKNAFGLED
jgi:hypothetical protein